MLSAVLAPRAWRSRRSRTDANIDLRPRRLTRSQRRRCEPKEMASGAASAPEPAFLQPRHPPARTLTRGANAAPLAKLARLPALVGYGSNKTKDIYSSTAGTA